MKKIILGSILICFIFLAGCESNNYDYNSKSQRESDEPGSFTVTVTTKTPKGARCGDNICQSFEQCSTCPEDCDCVPEVVEVVF